MRRWVRIAVTLSALLAPGLAPAQEEDPVAETEQEPVPEADALRDLERDRTRSDSARARAARDSVLSGSAARRELAKWAEPDSVMQSLLSREGYTPTRYQGERA